MAFNRKKLNKAFTLVELVISMSLFVLVAALVISFINFMGKNNARLADEATRNEQILSVRTEIDFWFSAFDNPNFTINRLPIEDNEGGIVCASATHKVSGKDYFIRFIPMRIDDQSIRVLQFTYPSGNHGSPLQDAYGNVLPNAYNHVFFECNFISAIHFAAFPDTPAPTVQDNQKILQFSIDCHVSDLFFTCNIVYN